MRPSVRSLLLPLAALLPLTGCINNVWQIAITGHVFRDVNGVLELATGEQVELCWEVDTQVEFTNASREELATGCESGATTGDGVFHIFLDGIGGRAVTDLNVTLTLDGETIDGAIVSRDIFQVSCESTYTYNSGDSYASWTTDECADDLYEHVSYYFVF